MVQGYYTLEESATILGISPEALKQLARKGEVRSFQDRGTWRFRIQDIQEMARRTSHGSDLELAVGESLLPMPTDSPAPRSTKPTKKSDEVFSFSLGDEDEANVDLGADIAPDKPAGSSSGKKSSSNKRTVSSGSDSDVRLVTGGGPSVLPLKGDSDVKLAEDAGPKSATRSSKKGMDGSKSSKPGKGKTGSMAPEPDSGIRLVPADSDSDVRISDSDDEHVSLDEKPGKVGTDSDIRLESHDPPAPAGPEGLLTEEIDLDEELEKEEKRRRQQKTRSKRSTKVSPYDLSGSELHLDPAGEEPLRPENESSSDFELASADESPVEDTADAFRLVVPEDDAITFADDSQQDMKAPHSGINLGHPADSGISLEQPEEATEEDFELTLEPESKPPSSKKHSTPKPGASSKLVEEEESDSSEFELSLDADAAATTDSDSEFELTLDDAGDRSPLEDEAASQDPDKDIFETDFDVPGLDEESGSEAVALEDAGADLASSDFDLDIGEEEGVVADDSGSEVVALDDETMVSTRKKRGKKKRGGDDEEVAEIDDADEDIVVEDEDDQMLVGAAAAPTAPWGIMPVAVLLPCVVVMVLLGMMGFELMQSQQGYKPGFLTKTITGLIDGKSK